MTSDLDQELTAEQIRALIAAEAVRRYGITGEDFIGLVRSGDVGEECGGSADLVGLVRLLPEGAFGLSR